MSQSRIDFVQPLLDRVIACSPSRRREKPATDESIAKKPAKPGLQQ
jgi:hypothetical protein